MCLVSRGIGFVIGVIGGGVDDEGVEDVLARRTRSLLLDARASIEAAPAVARLLGAELARDASWCEEQVRRYRELARSYLLDDA